MSLYKWSQTAASDATADSTINWAEGQAPSSINDSARAMMAATAKYRDDIAGAIITSGTSTAYTVSSYEVFDTLAHMSGQMIAFTPHTTNGATVTLNVDSLGAKPLRTAPNTELLAGTIIQGTPYVAVYNSADGAFYLQGFYGNPYSVPLGSGLDYWGPQTPNSCFVFASGNVLSTITYAALYTLFGTTYNIGNEVAGTFRIPDVRGRVIAAMDAMSGSPAGILTSVSSSLGSKGGAQYQALGTANLPPYTPSGSISSAFSGGPFPQSTAGGGVIPSNGGNFGFVSPAVSSTFAGNPQGGTSAPFTIVQPTIVCNYILRVI